MRIYYGTLIDSVVPLIAKHVPSIDDLKKYLERCFPELKPELYHAKSFDDVIDIATKKCTIIDIVCLEAIVDRFNIKIAVDHIIAYKTAVDLFAMMLNLVKALKQLQWIFLPVKRSSLF